MNNKERIATIQNKLLDRVEAFNLDEMSVREVAEVSDLVRRISEIKTEDMWDVYKAISSSSNFCCTPNPYPDVPMTNLEETES